MRIRRGLLFAGLFLIPLGGITLLVRAGTIPADAFDDIWRLWPLILIGFGVALLLGRSRAASVGTAVAALVLGTLVGGAIASGTGFVGSVGDCGMSGTWSRLDQSGTFEADAAVAVDLRCGSVALGTSAGSGWQVAADYQGTPPTVNGDGDGLEVDAAGDGARHDDLTVTVPMERLDSVDVRLNAATGSLVLDGAALSLLAVDANAGDVKVDAGSATVATLDVTMNACRLRVTLGSGSTRGAISVNAGAIDLCVPPDAELRLDVNDQLTFVKNLADRGLQQDESVWSRAGTSGSVIDLEIDGNVASLTLDPNGGCR
jgi:Domain of unknown function (DUF5668)